MHFERILRGKTLILLFNDSYKLYLESNRDLEERFNAFSFREEFTYSWKETDFFDNFKKNFFSILMTSILKNSDISEKRVVLYTSLLSCLRQLITSVDNIIDRESKGIIFLKSSGNDIITGGDGSDTLRGGDGNDTITDLGETVEVLGEAAALVVAVETSEVTIVEQIRRH